MIQKSKLGLKFFPRRFRRHVYLRDLSIVVMRDILQSRYLRRRVAHKQLARTSLSSSVSIKLEIVFTRANPAFHNLFMVMGCVFDINTVHKTVEKLTFQAFH